MGLIGRILQVVSVFVLLAIGALAGSERSNLNTRLAFLPRLADPRLELRMALRDAPRDGERIMELARATSKTAPLDPLAFEAGLVHALDRGDTASPGPMARAALARDPRSRPARIYRFEAGLRAGDWEAAIDELDGLYSLLPRQRAAILDLVAAQVSDRNAREALLARMAAGDPDWGRGLVARIALEQLDLASALDFYRPYDDLHSRLVSELVSEGRLNEAYLVWMLLQDDKTRQKGAPFDGRFIGSDAPRPFNWSIDKRHAEYMTGGGLYVSYFGTKRPRIVSQLMALTPGRYGFETDFDGDIPDAAGDLVWSVDCKDERRKLMTAPVSKISTLDPQSDLVFSVPAAGCDFQEIVLSGLPGEYPQTIRVSVRSIKIVHILEAPSR